MNLFCCAFLYSSSVVEPGNNGQVSSTDLLSASRLNRMLLLIASFFFLRQLDQGCVRIDLVGPASEKISGAWLNLETRPNRLRQTARELG